MWVAFGGKKYNFLAMIFILTKMQVSFVYHICFGLLNIGALLQKDAIFGQMLSILHIDIETGKAEPIVTLPSYGKN